MPAESRQEPFDSQLGAMLDKLKRTGEHIEQLHVVYERWRQQNPYRVQLQRQQHPKKPKVFKIVGTVEFTADVAPIRAFSIGAGELLYQCRSILEHLAYRLSWVESQPAAPPAGVGFPVFLDEKKYHAEKTRSGGVNRWSGVYRTRSMPEEASKIIEALQPFNSQDPDQHPLWLLHELSDADRHESPHIAAALIEAETIEVSELKDARLLDSKIFTGPFEHEAEVAKLTVLAENPKNFDVKLKVAMSGEMAFARNPSKTRAYHGLSAINVLRDIWFFLWIEVMQPLGPIAYPGISWEMPGFAPLPKI